MITATTYWVNFPLSRCHRLSLPALAPASSTPSSASLPLKPLTGRSSSAAFLSASGLCGCRRGCLGEGSWALRLPWHEPHERCRLRRCGHRWRALRSSTPRTHSCVAVVASTMCPIGLADRHCWTLVMPQLYDVVSHRRVHINSS